MDKSHTILAHLHLESENFELYECDYDKIIIGVNMFHLFKLINSIDNDDTLTIYIENSDYYDGIVSFLGLKFENGDIKQCKTQKLRLIEPLKEFFKDEVRILGKSLGLTKNINYKHPFPGPGLGIRIIGNITAERIKILQEADYIFINELIKKGLYNKIWQAYAALLPIKTVGVMGDARTYDYVCSLRAVTSVDGMTADYYPFDNNFLSETATKIINNVDGINRVTYDITSKPPGTIEWE